MCIAWNNAMTQLDDNSSVKNHSDPFWCKVVQGAILSIHSLWLKWTRRERVVSLLRIKSIVLHKPIYYNSHKKENGTELDDNALFSYRHW